MYSRFIVLDTETTGLNPKEGAALLEVAWLLVEKVPGEADMWATGEHDEYKIAFEGEIPPEARAVHHISPEEVRPGAPGVCERDGVVYSMCDAWEDGDVYVAHNAKFDEQFLEELPGPWICTYRCAKHLIPDAPRHSNQVLRYYLGLEPRPDLIEGLAPHRALYDIAVTGEILIHLLTLAPPEELIRLSTAPILEKKCGFGTHKDKLWSEVPRSYLEWILFKSDMPTDPDKMDVVYTARHYYEQ